MTHLSEKIHRPICAPEDDEITAIAKIKAAVDAGHSVHWSNTGYVVIRGQYQYLVLCKQNDHMIGLTNQAGTKLNGGIHQFFIAEPAADTAV